MLPYWTSTSLWENTLSDPGLWTRQRTALPRSSKALTTRRPRNPVPPVTKTTKSIAPSAGTAVSCKNQYFTSNGGKSLKLMSRERHPNFLE